MYDIRVCSIASNAGACFPVIGEVFEKWVDTLNEEINSQNPDFVAIHMQEFGNKNNLDLEECNKFLSDMKIYFNKIFPYFISFPDYDAENSDIYTALCNIYMWKKEIIVYVNDFKNGIKIRFRNKVLKNQFIFPFSDSNIFSLRYKFDLDFFPFRKTSRKGFSCSPFLLSRKKRCKGRNDLHLERLEINFINLHLIHDMSFNENIKYEKQSLYAEFRKRQLKHILEWLNTKNIENGIIFGDLNYRSHGATLVKGLFTQYTYEYFSEEEQSIFKSSDSQELVKCNPKVFYINPTYHPTIDNYEAYLHADTESIFLKKLPNLYEYEIKFPPTYCFDKTEDKIDYYLDTRCPSYCDRIILYGKKFIEKVLSENTQQTVNYNILGSGVFIGDHKPIILSLKL